MSKHEDRIAAMEHQLGLNTGSFAYCGHPECTWKIPPGFHGTIIATGVPRPSCFTGGGGDDT